MGHSSGSPRWDIPKGVAEEGESFEQAARRELLEETGIDITGETLVDLGVHRYLSYKNLALFMWLTPVMPDLKDLKCSTHFTNSHGVLIPEMDKFGHFPLNEAHLKVGKAMALVIQKISAGINDVMLPNKHPFV
jgi:predicted NUDIX family NTP pyrophosphohydrolase